MEYQKFHLSAFLCRTWSGRIIAYNQEEKAALEWSKEERWRDKTRTKVKIQDLDDTINPVDKHSGVNLPTSRLTVKWVKNNFLYGLEPLSWAFCYFKEKDTTPSSGTFTTRCLLAVDPCFSLCGLHSAWLPRSVHRQPHPPQHLPDLHALLAVLPSVCVNLWTKHWGGGMGEHSPGTGALSGDKAVGWFIKITLFGRVSSSTRKLGHGGWTVRKHEDLS